MEMVEYDTRDMSLNDCIEDYRLFLLEQEHNLLCEKFVFGLGEGGDFNHKSLIE